VTKIAQAELLIGFDKLSKSDIAVAGGKAASLGELTRAGINVPPGFVVTTEAYQLYSNSLLPEDLQQKILSKFDELSTKRVSVRSSAVAEDSSNSSWAGQFESYLNVTKDELIQKIYDCWKSVEGARAYATQQAPENTDTTLAVVVQKMVDSEVSGVTFTKNPVTASETEVMIEATYGLGELLVQGAVTPDNYLVNKNTLTIIDKQVPAKKSMLVYSDGKNTQQPVAADKSASACLDDTQIIELTRLAVKIEDHYGQPQDIEWALEGGQFYILQSRPITA